MEPRYPAAVPKKPEVRINHGSIYAREPQRAAEDLAHLTLYPHDLELVADEGRVVFRKTEVPPRGAGTHFNHSVPKSRKELEALCREREIACSWRDWQSLLEVWLEKDLLVEFVPAEK
jgi:hypothetical protein